MKLSPFKQKNIREILSWIKTEADMIQWAGSKFSWPLTQKQFREHLKSSKAQYPTLYPFGLYKGNKIIGYCEISDYRRYHHSAMLSRVLISPKNRNKGLGELMLKEILHYGFNELNLNRIGLGVFDFNVPAIRCYTKAGFVYEGTMRQSAKACNEYWSCQIMSLLKTEWKT
jgi:RimJ/RimL family protein N-acetyltransferase